jgi:hypothetical protein
MGQVGFSALEAVQHCEAQHCSSIALCNWMITDLGVEIPQAVKGEKGS